MSGGKFRAVRSQGERRRRRKGAYKGRVGGAVKARGGVAHGAAALLLAGAGLGPIAVHAQDATWTGTNGFYDDASNWTPHEVPTRRATFDGTGYHEANITQQTTAEFFRFEGTAQPTTINVYNGGTLTLNSTGLINTTDNRVTVNINGTPAEPGQITFSEADAKTTTATGSIRFNVSNGNKLVFTGLSGSDAKTTVNLQGAQSVLDLSSVAGSITIGGLVSDSTGQVLLSTNTLNQFIVNDSNTSVTFAGTISGPSTFTKDGISTYVLTGDNSPGKTTIANGTIQIGNGSTSGSLSGPIAVMSSGTLVFKRSDDVTISGDITGSGQIVKVGDNTTTLTGSGFRTGQTMIQGGTLQVGDGHATGALGTGAVTNNGTLKFNRSDDFNANNTISGSGALVKAGGGTMTLAGNNTYSGETRIDGGTLQVGSGGFGTLGTGAVTNNGTLKFNRGDDVTVANAISGTGTLVKAGGTTLTITGNNTYSGETRIDGGTLQVGSGTLGTGAVTNSGTLKFNRSDALTVSAHIGGSGTVSQIGIGTTTLTGANTYTGATTITAGTLQVGDGGSTGTLGTGAVTNNGTLAFNRFGSLVVSAAIGGTGNVTQRGSGTAILTADNTYTGTTTIEAGTLQVGDGGSTGTLGTGAVTNNGTLAFNRLGSLNVTANIGGTGAVRLLGGVTILSGDNSYSGGTTIDSGTLRIAGDGNLGAAAGGITFSGVNGTLQTTASMMTGRDITLDASGTLDVATNTVLTANGNITGAGGLTKKGSGTLELAGSNNFGGELVIFGGAVSIGSSANVGSGSIRVFNGSTFQTNGIFALANGLVMDTGGGTLQAAAGTLTASGVISGSGGLSKGGAGTLVLTGTNSYAGDTRLNAGTLAASADGNLGNGGRLVFGGGTLRYDASFASSRAISLNTVGSFDTNGNDAALTGTISGAGRLTKTGGGTLTLSGTNNYAGGTRIDGGTVAVSSNANLGASNGSLFLDGGTLRTTDEFNTGREIILLAGGGTFDVATGLALTGNITEEDGPGSLTKAGAGLLILAGTTDYSGGTTVLGGTLQGNTSTLRGDITNNATVSFEQASSGTYAGVMSGSGGLRISAGGVGGVVTLTGANTYTGSTTVAVGTLKGTTQTLQGNITVDGPGSVMFDQNTSGTYAGAISGTGRLTKSGTGTVILDGANSYTGGTTVSGGVLQGNTQSLQRNILNNATVAFDQTANGTYAGRMSGSGSLIKSGAGTLVLTDFNTYSGGTTVSAGTLQGDSTSLQGSILNNASVVFDQGTNGTYAGAMSGSGSLAKGGNGTLTLGGANSHTGGTTVNAGTLQL
ncbi:MAG TPA: autotransporter-associated beta strand repeat-containing protein, partial [Reyranella sp.]|nr:autotransporter-associated beta strand repeat-containing protein [Reyranella sp.]